MAYKMTNVRCPYCNFTVMKGYAQKIKNEAQNPTIIVKCNKCKNTVGFALK